MANHSVLERAFFLGIAFTSVAVLPASALTFAENIPSSLLQTSSPSNLIPLPNLTVPSIDGFTVQIRGHLNQRLPQLEMYCNSVFAIIRLAQDPWDRLFPYDIYLVSAPGYASALNVQVRGPDPTTVLKYKHLIMGIYELGCHFAQAEHFNYEAAFLSVDGQVTGIVSLQYKTPDQVGGHNATANNSNLVEVTQVAYNTSVADRPGAFVDPDDANLVIYYDKLGGNRLYINSLFTAFLDALANASPHDVDELGGSVNSISPDGHSRFVILDASTTGRPVLSWGRCIQAIGQLWRGLIALHEGLETMRFDIEYAGLKLGTGFMKAVTPVTGNDTAIARRVDN